MALILNIDTSTEKGSIAIARDGETCSLRENDSQKDHAAWIHLAIAASLAEAKASLQEVQAVGLTAGPGSYTGLRVGMASAKGLCYALQIPLITINTLEAMAIAAKDEEADLLCPMLDARRMEVFAALYNKKMEPLLPPSAMIVDGSSFGTALDAGTILFFGSGQAKLKTLLTHPHALFKSFSFHAGHLSAVMDNKYNLSEYTHLTYSEPTYIKEFYMNTFNKR